MTFAKTANLRTNPNNPRAIRKDQLNKLVKSLQEFPEMLEARPIVIDKDGTVLGGNMRLKAAQLAGLEEVPVYVREWGEDKDGQFIIKDNVSFGEWDWDMLANEWQSSDLNDWGLEVWQPEDPVSNETDYSLQTADAKLERFLDAKIKNITIPFEAQEFDEVVLKLEEIMSKKGCADYRQLVYKIIEDAEV